MAACGPEVFGADPVRIKWNAVRGDTAVLLVQFLEDDEVTAFDTDNWDFIATAYNPMTNTSDELDVEAGPGYAQITVPAFITESWGEGVGNKVAELNFDLQVITDDDVTWTPVIGTISVIGDITGGNF